MATLGEESKRPRLGCLEGCFEGLRRSLRGSLEASPAPAAVAPSPAWPKRLYFVRHGESEYNVYFEKHSEDPMNMYDAPLTAKGRDQAKALQPSFANLAPVQLVVSSPLTRAMQTCLLAMPPALHAVSTYEATPLCSEHLEASCDIGRIPAELAEEFSTFDFRALPDVWWYVPDECRQGVTSETSKKLFAEDGRREPPSVFHGRVDAFAAWLSEKQESSIAVFAHADFFCTLLERHFAQRDARYKEYWMTNCELLELVVTSPQDLLEPPKMLPEPELAPSPPPVEEAPKAPSAPSAAAMGIQALKKEIAQAKPHLKPGEVMKEAALQWKTMDPAAKARYMSLDS